MSIKVMTYVWDHSKSKANNRLMLLAIADIANDSGDAYPGVDRLAAKCNISHRCAQDSIKELEREGELCVFENVGTKTKSGWTNLYRVTMNGVQQSEIRTPTGEIAVSRPITDKKSRLFPKDMQLVAPLSDSQEVQTDSPLENEDMQPVTPDGVQTVAPNPSEYPSGLNTNTSVAIAPAPAHPIEVKPDVVKQAVEHLNVTKPRNLLMDAVTVAFKIEPGGYAQLLLKQLTGDISSKGKRLEYLITPPMEAPEILACRDWYGTDPRYKDKGALPQTAETIYERVLEFRAQPDYDRYVARVMAIEPKAEPEEPEKELPPSDPEKARLADEIIERMARGESINELVTG